MNGGKGRFPFHVHGTGPFMARREQTFSGVRTLPADLYGWPSQAELDAPKGEWIDWHGGECPVEPKAIVEVRLRCGKPFVPVSWARKWRWHHNPAQPEMDIVAYRVNKSD